jgi:hypothetical protein
VLHLGSIVLASVLLGVPRALDARSFGAQGSVYVEVSPAAPELQEFARELERALVRASLTLSARRCEATTVIDVLGVARSAGPEGRTEEAIALATHDGPRQRRLVLHYSRGHAAAAMSELLARLGPFGLRES